MKRTLRVAIGSVWLLVGSLVGLGWSSPEAAMVVGVVIILIGLVGDEE